MKNIVNETGLTIDEWVEYWRDGNDAYRDDLDPDTRMTIDIMRNDLAVASERIRLLLAMVRAVNVSDFGGIGCVDLDGRNWFDLRDEIAGGK